jgi:hypothetical protein
MDTHFIDFGQQTNETGVPPKDFLAAPAARVLLRQAQTSLFSAGLRSAYC